MILAIVLAGLAAMLACAAPAGQVVRRRLVSGKMTTAPAARGRRQRRRAVWLMAVIVLAIVVVLAGLLIGVEGSAPIVVGTVIGATFASLARKTVRRRQASRQRKAVTQACTMLAAQVRVGQIPLDALRSVATDCPILAPGINTADLGGDVVQQWRSQANEPGQFGLADLGRAWELSVSTGASMANSLDDIAHALNDDEALSLVVNSEAAGPRASGKIMAVLPFVAMGMGYLLGGDPLGFLFGSPFGWICLTCGCIFACGGVLWMDRVADHATAGT